MKLTLHKIIGVVASSTFLFAAFFSDAINFASRWEDDRASITARSVDNYTDNMTGQFDQKGHDKNMVELGRFYELVK